MNLPEDFCWVCWETVVFGQCSFRFWEGSGRMKGQIYGQIWRWRNKAADVEGTACIYIYTVYYIYTYNCTVYNIPYWHIFYVYIQRSVYVYIYIISIYILIHTICTCIHSFLFLMGHFNFWLQSLSSTRSFAVDSSTILATLFWNSS